MSQIRTNSSLLANPAVTPRTPRWWLGLAIGLTAFFHLLLLVVAMLWRIPEWVPEEIARLIPRVFQIADIPERPKDLPPGIRSGGPTVQPLPGAPQAVAPPDTEEREFDRAFAIATPQPGSPPEARPTFDASPVAVLPAPAAPTLLPMSERGAIPASEPSSLVRPGGAGAQASDAPPAFDLPASLPGALAAEDLASIEGGGIGAGGPGGGGEIPQFSDIEKLINSELRELIMSPQGLIIRLSNEVLFDFDSDKLKADGLPTLQKLARLIQRYPGAEVSVDGHSDTIGEEAYNLSLSERRARAVGNWLNNNLATQLSALRIAGFGESRPIVKPNGTAEEQALNRRVDIHLKAKAVP